MAPLRVQCLSTSSKLGAGLKAAFSTSRSTCLDSSRSIFSSTSDLASLDSRPSQAQSSGVPSRSSPRPSSVLNIPGRRGGLRNTQNNIGGHERLEGLIAQQERKKQARAQAALNSGRPSETTNEMLERDELSKNLGRQIKRHFKHGDIYAPHDLSWQEQKRWQKKDRPTHDIFDIANFNPLDHYKNFMVMSEYMSPLGRIMHSKETGLRPVNQRRIAKAIRRTIGMGMMPSVHRHPELLQQAARKFETSGGFYSP